MFTSLRIILLLLSIFITTSAFAIEVFEFENESQRQQFQSLAEELRCPVCQNQSLADSGAGLADDLRQEIYDQIQTGKSHDDIVQFMVARYGDFIIYRPRFNAINLLLWTGPIVLLLLGFWFLLAQIKQQGNDAGTDDSLKDDEKQRLQDLLNKDQ